MSKVVSVYGANGSGKTTIAVNLAYSLAETGAIVGILSTDLSHPSLTGFLGMSISSHQPNWEHLCIKGYDIKDVARYFVPHPKYSNLFVLSVSNEANCLTYAGDHIMDNADKVIAFYKQLEVSDFDYVILDLDNDVNNLLSTYGLYYSTQIIHTVIPHIQGLTFFNAYELFIEKMRNKANGNPIIHVSNADRNYFGLSKFEEAACIKFDHNLPYEEQAVRAENDGIPLLESFEQRLFSSKYPKFFSELSEHIQGKESKQKRKGGG